MSQMSSKNKTLSIISLNVRGLRNENKRRSIFSYYRKRADILVLQETHCTTKDQDLWTNEWGGLAFFSNYTSTARGVCILIRRGVPVIVNRTEKDDQGRILACDIANINNLEDNFSILAVYAPNINCPEFFQKVVNFMLNGCSQKVVIGDMNVTLDDALDRQNCFESKIQTQKMLLSLMQEWNLIDIWRVRNPTDRYMTWCRFKPDYTASRIDYALINEGFTTRVANATHLTGIRTDHNAVYIAIELSDNCRGPGYWKLDCALLTQKEYVQKMNDLLTSKIYEYEHLQPSEAWDLIKKDIADVSKKFRASAREQLNVEIANLSEKIYDQEVTAAETPTADLLDNLYQNKLKLNQLIESKTDSLIFRSKAKWYHLGEKSTKYFLNLEKMRYNARTCHALLINDQIISDPTEVLKQQEKFYRELYQKDDCEAFSYQNSTEICISHADRVSADTDFTEFEVKKAIKGMNNGKTPGNDGIPVEFYKVFWNKINKLLMAVIEEANFKNRLHESACTGVINLIPKQNKDTRILKNLRPITLLNVDYKIIEKILANRMQPLMEKIINIDQKGFMSNRKISANIRKICDIITYCTTHELEMDVVSIDLQKAFDKIDLNYLKNSLAYFNFGPQFIRWVTTLYNGFTVRIQNNGYFSESINIERGIHQGGCCSSLYFLCCAEILAIEIRKNEIIEGLVINDVKYLLGQFADDTDSTIKHKQQTFDELLKTIDRFTHISGLSINYDKTTIYRIGSIHQTNAKLYSQKQLAWTNDPINVLGVWIDVNENDMTSRNFEDLVTKAEKTLNTWSNRSMSLCAKILIVNTMIASLFVYRMTVLPTIPKEYLKQLNTLIENFIWNNKTPKIPMQILQNELEYGGLKLVNLECKDAAIKISWVEYLEKDSNMANLVYENINPALGNLIWDCNIKQEDVPQMRIQNKFWEDVLIAWSKINYVEKISDPFNQIIWFNTHVRVNNKTLCWNSSINQGLIYVRQLMNTNNEIMTAREINEKFHTGIMRANQLITALPKHWLQIIRNKNKRQPGENEINKRQLINKRNLSKLAYQKINKNDLNKNRLSRKWELWNKEIPQIFPSYEDFLQKFRNIRLVTNTTKYRSFQYRMLTRSTVTNVQLYHWGILDSPLCYYCKRDKEKLGHLMYACPVIKDFWEDVCDFMRNKFPTQATVTLSIEKVITNQIVDEPTHLYNFICLLAKQYIYAQRCLNRELKIESFIQKVLYVQRIEKYIAASNNQMFKHNKKWKDRIEMLSQNSIRGNEPLSDYVLRYVDQIDVW